MARVAGAREVERLLRTASREARASLRAANQQAAKFISRARYDEADKLVSLARAIAEFVPEMETLRERWRSLNGESPRAQSAGKRTPLWMYYQPIARALVELDGSAAPTQVVQQFETTFRSSLQPGDLAFGADGQAKWRKALGRVRKAMIREGFLEATPASRWSLTDQGRRLAKSKSSSGASPPPHAR